MAKKTATKIRNSKMSSRASGIFVAGHYFSAMGRSNTFKREGKRWAKYPGFFSGPSISDLLAEDVGVGDRFLVTVERLPRLARGPRFPANPWARKSRRRRHSS